MASRWEWKWSVGSQVPAGKGVHVGEDEVAGVVPAG